MSYLLDAVQEAAEHRARSHLEYVDAVERAREGGCSLRAIATAAGTSHVSIVRLLRRHTATAHTATAKETQ